MTFDLCTWNIGSHTDYRRNHAAFANASDEEIRSRREELFHRAWNHPLLSSVKVFAFQEMHANDWPAQTAKLFIPPSFDLFADHDGRDRDTVVAWDTRCFDRIACFSIASRDKMWFSAVAHLACKNGGDDFIVCSVHLTGFNQSATKETLVAQAEMGDVQLREILNGLNQYCATKKRNIPIFFCGDLNADHAVYDVRHQILNTESHYNLITSNILYTFWDENLNRAVTLDYIYTRHVDVKCVTHVQTPFMTLLHDENPADHLPVVVKVTFPQKLKSSFACFIF